MVSMEQTVLWGPGSCLAAILFSDVSRMSEEAHFVPHCPFAVTPCRKAKEGNASKGEKAKEEDVPLLGDFPNRSACSGGHMTCKLKMAPC